VDGAGPVGLVVAEFREWLAGERGLAAEAVRCYGNHAHTFLAWLGDPLDQVLAGLEAGTVTTFMVEQCEQVLCANAKASVAALRALSVAIPPPHGACPDRVKMLAWRNLGWCLARKQPGPAGLDGRARSAQAMSRDDPHPVDAGEFGHRGPLTR